MNPTDAKRNPGRTKQSTENRATIPPAQISPRETVLPSGQDSVPVAGASASAVPRDFGRYQVLECLGQGAMGAVYKARDTQLDRVVALKIPKFSTQAEPGLLERFYREARSAATLSHPNICPVYDVGEHAGTHYISMGYIAGRPLSAFIKPGKPLPDRKAAGVVRKLAQALEEAHRRGIIHRDLKPDNVMIDHRGQPIIMDFGLAQQAGAEGNIRATLGGQMVGTPAYMSPEQVDGDLERIGSASDVYSLGVIFYELLTGSLPFQGSMAAVLAQIINGRPTPPSEHVPGLDPGMEAICLKMMAADPNERYQTMTEVNRALAEWNRGATSEAGNSAPSSQPPRQESEDELAALFSAIHSDAKPIHQTLRPETRTAGARTKQDKRQKPFFKRPWAIWSAAGLAGVLLVLGIVLFVRVGEQMVRIEIDDPKAQVFVDGDQVTIKNLGADVELKPGKHNLEVRRDDIVVQTDAFEVIKGKEAVLKINVIDEPPAVAASEPTSRIPMKVADPAETETGSKPVMSKPQPAEPSAPSQEPEADADDLDRQVAEWVIGMKGSLAYVTTPGQGGHYTSRIESLPSEKFSVYDVRLPEGSKVTLEQMKQLSKLPKLVALYAPKCGVMDEHLALLAGHPKMHHLELSGNRITNAGIKHFQGMNSLNHLSLSGNDVTAEGVAPLGDLRSLKGLELDDTKISDDTLAPLLKMSRLTTLSLNDTAVSDRGVEQLSRMQNLWQLSLNGTQITDAAIKKLAGHRGLHRLELAETGITDEGLSHLSDLPKLISLNISGCRVTNEGIVEHVASLERLEELHLANTALTDEGLEVLARHPKLRIVNYKGTQVSPEAAERFYNRKRASSPPRSRD